MRLLIHDATRNTDYIAEKRSDCRDSIDASLWDMHEMIPDKAWCIGKASAIKLD